MQDDVSVSPAAVCSDTRITIADVIDTGFHSGLSKYPACGAVLIHVTMCTHQLEMDVLGLLDYVSLTCSESHQPVVGRRIACSPTPWLC